MKKIFLTIQFAALMAGLPAFALVGGPFDNGEYSILNERSGYYQSSYTFKNGSGYSLWTADNAQGALSTGNTVTQNIGAGALNTGASNNANRTVLYYKGVTYFGGAFGQVDVTARHISGYANASSEFTTAITTSQGQTGFFGQTNVSSFNSSNVVSNGRSYVANLAWTGKITDTAAQLRFSGDGELVIIAPTGQAAIAGLAYEAYSGLVQAIVQSVSGLTVQPGASLGIGPAYLSAQQAIGAALTGSPGTAAIAANVTPAFTYTQASGPTGLPVDVNGNGIFNDDLVPSGYDVLNTIATPATAAVTATPGLADYLTGTGPTQSYDESDKVKISVTGYRRYF